MATAGLVSAAAIRPRQPRAAPPERRDGGAPARVRPRRRAGSPTYPGRPATATAGLVSAAAIRPRQPRAAPPQRRKGPSPRSIRVICVIRGFSAVCRPLPARIMPEAAAPPGRRAGGAPALLGHSTTDGGPTSFTPGATGRALVRPLPEAVRFPLSEAVGLSLNVRTADGVQSPPPRGCGVVPSQRAWDSPPEGVGLSHVSQAACVGAYGPVD